MTEEQENMVWDVIKILKAKPCEDTISRKHLLSEIDDLMQSPWFNRYKDDEGVLHHGYLERKEAVEIVRDLCVKAEPPVIPKQPFINKPCVSSGVCEHDKQNVLDKIRAEIEQEYTKFRNKSDIWSERACGLGTALEIIDKYKEGESE